MILEMAELVQWLLQQVCLKLYPAISYAHPKTSLGHPSVQDPSPPRS